MERLKFDSQGKLFSVDNARVDNGYSEEDYKSSDERLKTSSSLAFLTEEGNVLGTEKDRKYWSLYSNGSFLEPLLFSNGKTQEDVVKEVVELIRGGIKIVFVHGVCGTGKSAIALNIARVLGRASIVVPVKSLQRQYEEDYMGKKYLLNSKGGKIKIAMITGRDNHDSLIKSGVSCADFFLPDTIKITEKNYGQIMEFYNQNPLIKNKLDSLDVRQMKRISIAPANPYWSPIVSAEFQMPLADAKKKRYRGLNGKEFIFYHRKKGCSYFDQYQSYIDSDIIIFNSAKYKIENSLERKPETDVEIIDEADEFLDNFSSQEEINLTRLSSALKNIFPEDEEAQKVIDEVVELIKLEEKNKSALGVEEDKIFDLKDTKVEKILRLLLKNKNLEVEISLDELNYANKALDAAKEFKDFINDTYVTFKRRENDLYANLVTTNLSNKFKEIIERNKAIVLMSGTLHSEEVIRHIFGIDNFKIVDAETLNQGNIEIHRTGKEIDCRYANFKNGKHTRKDYLIALSASLEKAKKPILVHVNAYEDLPTNEEINNFDLTGIMSKERLIEIQGNDKTGRMISLFKSKMSDSLFTTKCSRGVDFPGDTCNSVVFTKYPNPNVNGTFWKILEKTHKDFYWEFYRDKARREFLQRIYRAVRSKTDHVFVLSPDIRVLEAVRDLQLKGSNKN